MKDQIENKTSAAATGSAITDRVRLDWLERIMTPREGYVEVYLAGLRSGDAPATSFQFETNPHDPKWCLTTGRTLRDAIDDALIRYLASSPNDQAQRGRDHE